MTFSEENQKEKKLYGIHFRKNDEYEELFHEDKDKIVELFTYFKSYGILSDLGDDFHIKSEIGRGNFSKVLLIKRKYDKK